ncbi:MAG: SDR family NAD(P)-dependent oxidoreductase [Desulfobacterales bacterium]|nr:SDR family NAD(P)-dependent oxidoreductase [Desulfobacterales bacterium]
MSVERHYSPVAIVGLSAFFPRSMGLKGYWRLLRRALDAISEVPPSHWAKADYYDPDPKRPDHVYCSRGGFLPPVDFDPAEFGIPPATLEATDSSQLLALAAAQQALDDAGLAVNRARTSVILGVTGTQELVIPLSSRLGHPHWRKALAENGVDPERSEKIVRRIAEAYVPWQENSFPGLLGNVVAGRIANRLDLGGTNCVVDAACASSLAAVHLALLELTSGRCDAAITGGADTLNDIFMHMCFSKTRILSPTGDVRPFSRNADGTLLGEGIGLLVLKRLADAERDTVELVEAHGTGTRVGDKVEFEALCRVMGGSRASGRRCALGSVKSMIGHTKAAAGAAGLVKAALALHHKVLPATLKAEESDPALEIERSPFYLNTRTRPWVSTGRPRRAGVSSFGFGGSNFHLVLEEHRSRKSEIAWDGAVQILAFSADTAQAVSARVRQFAAEVRSGRSEADFAYRAAASRAAFDPRHGHRLLAVIEAPEAAAGLLEKALPLMAESGAAEAAGAPNLFYGRGPVAGKVAFLFPGQGSQYPGMMADLACVFPKALAAYEAADRAAGLDPPLSELALPRPGTESTAAREALRATETAQPAIGAASLAALAALAEFGVQPDAAGGHSFGELTALCAAGWMDETTFFDLAIARGRAMARAGSGGQGTMAAVRGPVAEIEALIAGERVDVVLANRNSPQQAVLSGSTAAVAEAARLCRAQGFAVTALTVGGAFHSPLMRSAQAEFAGRLEQARLAPAAVPVFSNIGGQSYPRDPNAARHLLGEHLGRPVDFVAQIEAMRQAGIGTFLEVGPKSVLTGLVTAILAGSPAAAIAVDASAGRRDGMVDLATALCRLAALGHPVALEKWEAPAPAPKPMRMPVAICGANYRSPRPRIPDADPPARHLLPAPAAPSPAPLPSPGPGRSEPFTLNDSDTMRKETPDAVSETIPDALRSVQEGLKTIQAIQLQTARAHEKFLETQAEATRVLLELVQATGRLAGLPAGQAPGLPAAAPTLETRPPAAAPLPPAITAPVAAAAAPPPAAAPPADPGLAPLLLAVVAELTGYPAEMLGLDMDIGDPLRPRGAPSRPASRRTRGDGAPQDPRPDHRLPGRRTGRAGPGNRSRGAPSRPRSRAPAARGGGRAHRLPRRDARPRHGHRGRPGHRLHQTGRGEAELLPERRAVALQAADLPEGPPVSIPTGRKVYITDDRSGLSQALVAEFGRIGIHTVLVSIDILQHKKNLPPAAGLIIVPDPASANMEADLAHAFELTRTLGADLGESARQGGAFFTTVTRMDGAFGFSGRPAAQPIQGALAGLAKTAAVEWPEVVCRALDVDPETVDLTAAARTAAAHVLRRGPVEVGIGPGGLRTPVLVPEAYPVGEMPLQAGDAVVVSGGARGITAACALELARRVRPRLILLGRSPAPAPEPEWMQGAAGEAEIKKALLDQEFAGTAVRPADVERRLRQLLANREVAQTLAAIQAAGCPVRYYAVDVRREDEVSAALADARAQFGPIRGLIHGAGVLEDRLIIQKSKEQFERVFATKLHGFRALLAASASL